MSKLQQSTLVDEFNLRGVQPVRLLDLMAPTRFVLVLEVFLLEAVSTNT